MATLDINGTGWPRFSFLHDTDRDAFEMLNVVYEPGVPNISLVSSATVRPDMDGDEIVNPNDNCPGAANLNQLDTDGDGKAMRATLTEMASWT